MFNPLHWFNTLANPWVKLILRSPLHGLLSNNVMLLSFTGRNSGRQFTTPVMYTRRGQQLIVAVAQPENKQWWKNYRQPGQVTMRVANATVTGVAETVTDSETERLDALYKEVLITHPKLAALAGYALGRVEGCVAVEITLQSLL